jgi:tetratricopeptide (TPR) repeat protein
LAVFWLVMALAPVPALVARLRRRSQRPKVVKRDPIDALAAAARVDDAWTLRRNFVHVLASRLGCSAEDFTHPGALERALRRAGVSEDTATRAEGLLRELDVAAYTRTSALPRNAPRNAVAIARAVDVEALARTELPFWIPIVLIAFSLGIVVNAIAADVSEAHFARGVSAYLRHDYQAARGAFADAVSLAPTAPDAWANYGTASWALADTAAAVLGWRQALAVEPAASDLHQRIAVVGHDGPSSPGWVPSLPRNASVWAFGLLWLAAWAFAWSGRRAPAWTRRVSLPLVACALVVGLVSIELETRVSGAKLAVVRRQSALTSDPAIGMDRRPGVATGEIVRVAGRHGTWTRVEAAGDRDGWIPSSQLLLLDDRRPPRD